MSTALSLLWERNTCEDLVHGQYPITVDSDMLIEDACNILAKNNITCAPIRDENSSKIVGVLDYSDIAALLLAAFRHRRFSSNVKTWREDCSDYGIDMGPIRVESILNSSFKSSFVSLPPSATLIEAVKIFATGVHRIIVLEDETRLTGILTQSRVLRFVLENRAEFHPYLENPLSAIRISTALITKYQHDLVLDAIAILHENGLSALPIVDTHDSIISVISLSDLKFVFRKRLFSILWKSCADFTSLIRSYQSLEDHSGRDYAPAFQVTPSCSLEYAVEKLCVLKAHRLWICERPDVKPYGIVSLTDIIQYLNPEKNC